MRTSFLLTVSVFTLSLVAAILFVAREKETGAEAWEKARAAFLASGESLDPSIRFHLPVPDGENLILVILPGSC